MAAEHINGIPRVAPTERPSAWGRAARRLVSTKAGTAIHRTVGARADGWLLRATGGRVTAGLGVIPLVGLISTGARSGRPRHAALAYFTDGDDVVLIASSYGRERHPGWYHNLKAHPECELRAGRRGGRFVAREVAGDERDRLFALAAGHYAGYGTYALRTDGVRTIPVLRLSPADSSTS
jgi:deazaflavin-dependent oxidoreductase (nitroreductase family)